MVQLPIDFFGAALNILLVTDADDQVEEHTGELNNVSASVINVTLGPIADLQVSGVSVDPTFIIDDPAA